MFELSKIEELHLELSSRCNARCPLCARNFHGYPKNLGYDETDLSLNLIIKRFSIDFIKQLKLILINGNFGDFVMNNESLKIIEYFRSSNPKLRILISSNSSARDKNFWTTLASLNVEMMFCLDGLEDTHHLYRQDTNFHKILQNAAYFIEAGGYAIWKMILFDHNKHQVDECQLLSEKLGFKEFRLLDEGRNDGPVFDRQGNWSHDIGKVDKKYKTVFEFYNTKLFYNNKIPFPDKYETEIEPKCKALDRKTIYISANGEVFPCCWLGHSPSNYDYFKINKPIATLLENNNLHMYDLETCLKWMKKVKESWNINSYDKGRLQQCDVQCGKCKPKKSMF